MFTITAARRLNRRIAGVSLGAALIVVGAVGAQSFADGGEAGDSPPPPPGAEIAPEEPQPSPVAGGENTLIQTTGATFDETVLTKFMPAAAFQPLQSALDLDLDAVSLNGEGCVSPLTTASSGSTARLLAPVELPDGAVIKRVSFSGVDNSPGDDISVTLTREQFTAELAIFPNPPTYTRAGTEVDAFSTSGADADPRVFSGAELSELAGTPSGGSPIVTFRHRFHTVMVRMVNDADTDHVLCGVRIDYQVAKSSADPGTVFHPVAPVRAFDSRRATFPASGLLAPGATKVVSVANGYDLNGVAIPAQANVVPANATAVAYNITVAGATGSNFVAVTPGDAASFTASAINYNAGSNVANAATVSIAPDRTIKLWGGDGPGSANVIIDITGYYAPAPPLPNMAS